MNGERSTPGYALNPFPEKYANPRTTATHAATTNMRCSHHSAATMRGSTRRIAIRPAARAMGPGGCPNASAFRRGVLYHA